MSDHKLGETTDGPEVTATNDPEVTYTNGQEMSTTNGPEMTTTNGTELTTNNGPELTTNNGPELTTTNGPELTTTTKGPMEVDSQQTDQEIKKEKSRILKHIFLISFAFLLNFTAFQGLSRLQSSLHRTEGMGVINSSVLYASLMISCMFIPKLMTSKIGHKWTIPISFLGYILWMAANGYAVWGTMVPASIIVGFCAAPLWTAQCAYFTKMGNRYAALNNEPEQAVVTRFFGYFFMFFQMCEYHHIIAHSEINIITSNLKINDQTIIEDHNEIITL